MAILHRFLKLLLIASVLFNGCQGSKRDHWKSRYPFIQEASTWRTNGGGEVYDYIIIGGGTAGCPLAATLSRNFKVLLLERGGVPFNNRNVSHRENFHITVVDRSLQSPSQHFISTDGVVNTRARILGGGSSINAGFYSRASPSYVERAGWDGHLVNQSYQWIEKQIVQKPKFSPWQEAVMNGLLDVGVQPNNGFSYDHKYGTKVGGTIFDERGHRHTSAELLASANPKNLQVLIHAKVQKIIFHTKTGAVPKAIGVIFKDERGEKHEIFLSENRLSEIILSSGAIGSPQLLLLSGVGDRADLETKNISIVLDNRNVGKDMADNPSHSIIIPTEDPVQQSLVSTVGITRMGVYIEASSGFGRKSDSIITDRTLEASQAHGPRKRNIPYELFKGVFLIGKIMGPFSKGELRLKTTNADDNPTVTFNYFQHPKDLTRCVYSIRLMEKVLRSKQFADLTNSSRFTMDTILKMSLDSSMNLIPKHTNSTESLQQFCKDSVTTIWHYHGGCHVGKVVDRTYRVIGVDQLRVIDGSIFRDSPGTNPQATAMMIGRYMGVKILRERLGQGAGM